MDLTKKSPNVLSLCSGYGGLELGLKRVFGGVSILTHVEIETFAIANLVNKMETGQMVPAPVWTDLKTLNARPFRGNVDIITGGYPCQPFSAAGKRGGADDPRHLWPFIGGTIKGRQNIIEQCEPGGVFFENVEGHLSLGVSEVLADLERMGYTVTAGIFSAAEVGAPHQRKRVFILGRLPDADSINRSAQAKRRVDDAKAGHSGEKLANAGEHDGGSLSQRGEALGPCKRGSLWPAQPGEDQHEWEEPRVVADTESKQTRRLCKPEQQSDNYDEDRGHSERDNGCPKEIRKAQPRLSGATNERSYQMDRLRLLGNGVVPQVAEKAFRTLYEKIHKKSLLFQLRRRNILGY